MIQEFSSAATSINSTKIPKLFTLVSKHFGWKRGTINLDLGGGKYDTATNYLKMYHVDNYIWDKYNRSYEHNSEVENKVHLGCADTVTLSNVLNVIKEQEMRAHIILLAWEWVKPNGRIYISVYNSKKEGESKPDCWQNAMTLQEYLKEVKVICPNAVNKHGIIVIQEVLK